MICIGIDVSKGKSTVCGVKGFDEVIFGPLDISHTTEELALLAEQIKGFGEPVRVVMESTGHYHIPVAMLLLEKGLWVSVENAYRIKKSQCYQIRGGKTDRLDSKNIANYGICFWKKLLPYQIKQNRYYELKILLKQYETHMKLHVAAKQNLIYLMDQCMPGIKKALDSSSASDFRKVKYKDFAEEFWHLERIKKPGKKHFIETYKMWCLKEKYQFSQTKAEELYHLAETGIATLPSKPDFTKTVVKMAAQAITQSGDSLNQIIAQMQEIAKTLKEYDAVRQMEGVGERLSIQLIAAIGDVRKYHSAKALVAYAGLDVPQYQSGQFYGSRRRISKRGNPQIRKIGYEVMRSIKMHKPKEDRKIYDFIIKKEKEGKAKTQAKIAGLNKFLHIYYARVNALYSEKEKEVLKIA